MASSSGTVFRGVTDGNGRFETTPLEPGVYFIQLRIPKTIAVPTRYTLALSGARPLGDALTGPGVALGMNAEVRRLGPVRGFVNGRRVAVAPTPAAPMPAPALLSPGAYRPLSANRAPVPASSPAVGALTVARPMGTPARTAINPGTTIVAASPPTLAASPARGTMALPTLLPRPANSQPRLVNGRRYVWVASGRDSNLGYWASDNTAAQPAPGVRATVPSTSAVTRPSPSPTPRRR